MADKEPVVVQKPLLLTAPSLVPSSSMPSLHSGENTEGQDAREDSSGRETEHSITDSNSHVEEADLSAYTIPTTLRVAILCRHWNGFEGSCARLDTCNFKHSTQFSVKEPCRNWRLTGQCQYGQNCNYFHPIANPYAASDESTKSSPRPLAHPLPGKKKQNSLESASIPPGHANTSREDLLAGASGGRRSYNRDSSRSTMSGGSSHSHGGGLASPPDRDESKWGRRSERAVEKPGQHASPHQHHRHSISGGDHSSRDSESASHDFAEDTASRREAGPSSRPGSTSSSMSRDTTQAYNALFSITINNAIYNSALPSNCHSPRQSVSAPSNPLSPRTSPISHQYLRSSLSGSSSSENATSSTSFHGNSNSGTKNSQHSKSTSSHYSNSGGGSQERSGGNNSNYNKSNQRKDSRHSNSNYNTASLSRSGAEPESNNPLFRAPNANSNSNNRNNNSSMANFASSSGGGQVNGSNAPEPVKKTISKNPLYKKKQPNRPLVLGGDGR